MPTTESNNTYFQSRGLARQEIVDFWGLTGLLLLQNPLEKVMGEAPTFSNGFVGRKMPFRHCKSKIYTPASPRGQG